MWGVLRMKAFGTVESHDFVQSVLLGKVNEKKFCALYDVLYYVNEVIYIPFFLPSLLQPETRDARDD